MVVSRINDFRDHDTSAMEHAHQRLQRPEPPCSRFVTRFIFLNYHVEELR